MVLFTVAPFFFLGEVVKKEISGHKSLIENVFLTIVSAELVGKQTNTKVRSEGVKASALTEAILATKKFEEELNSPTATLNSVMKKLGEKHIAASNFERVFSMRWPL